jgi:hypothetical protein
VELLTTTLKLVVREGVRVLDLASGGLGCSLVALRAGCYMQPLGFLEGEKRFPRWWCIACPALGAILLSNYGVARVFFAELL